MNYSDELYNEYFESFKIYHRVSILADRTGEDYITINNHSYSVEFCERYAKRLKKQNETLWHRVSLDYENIRARKYRCNHRIHLMLDYDLKRCFFLTFTFNDETLSKLNADSRKQYVIRYLKKHFSQYVANIDYGSKNEREHYHAIGVIKNGSILIPTKQHGVYNLAFYDKGFTTAKTINSSEDYLALSGYINKLTNHAFKTSNKAQKLIYSRNFTREDIDKLKLLEYELEDIFLYGITSYDLKQFLKRKRDKRDEINNLQRKIKNMTIKEA